MRNDLAAYIGILSGQALALAGIRFGWPFAAAGILLTLGGVAHLDWALRSIKADGAQ